MTREEYKALKEQLKEWAIHQKQRKKMVRQWFSENPNKSPYGVMDGPYKWESHYTEYRSGHIFMSLVRGKTRTQIEGNFEDQKGLNWIDEDITDLCLKYNFEADHDERGRVISIMPIAETVAS
jgi:DNA repair exonuclease SbcCD ATPase subunit